MEKLEKHIKEKLEGRKITPSSKAWDKISDQIISDDKPKRKLWYPYAIAASVVGILLVSLFFLKSEEIQQNTIQLVEENNSKKMNVPSKDENIDFQKVELERPKVASVEGKNVGASPSQKEKTPNTAEQIVVVEDIAKGPLNDSFLKESDHLIAEKLDEVVAQVELLEKINTEVSDAEIDSLLRAAQRQILSEQLFTKDGTVDAMALLTEVEDELDGTFRDQIFDALKEGYFKLRTAVADRNN